MKRSLVVVGILAAVLAGTAEARPAVRPFENDGDPVLKAGSMNWSSRA